MKINPNRFATLLSNLGFDSAPLYSQCIGLPNPRFPKEPQARNLPNGFKGHKIGIVGTCPLSLWIRQIPAVSEIDLTRAGTPKSLPAVKMGGHRCTNLHLSYTGRHDAGDSGNQTSAVFVNYVLSVST
jgi:hypothetical protein